VPRILVDGWITRAHTTTTRQGHIAFVPCSADRAPRTPRSTCTANLVITTLDPRSCDGLAFASTDG
jgi:hypothetical protein